MSSEVGVVDIAPEEIIQKVRGESSGNFWDTGKSVKLKKAMQRAQRICCRFYKNKSPLLEKTLAKEVVQNESHYKSTQTTVPAVFILV